MSYNEYVERIWDLVDNEELTVEEAEARISDYYADCADYKYDCMRDEEMGLL